LRGLFVFFYLVDEHKWVDRVETIAQQMRRQTLSSAIWKFFPV
jgi:hypothetical protein